MIDGSPSFTTEVVFDEADPNIAGGTGTAARAVNSVSVVCAAPAGVCSFLDLPIIPAAPIAELSSIGFSRRALRRVRPAWPSSRQGRPKPK